ncbi:helix-turn-helix domain-containing protein [Aquimarina sp. AU119]|uniref:helix-turn-helix domain-containing protein n=1 Tax=Aquimarina sp. AU119 TaxID=2108528 RepID=UPI000D698483|nr:helix-turn-helix domain-containing protein [Aquimarina sp. AU119]
MKRVLLVFSIIFLTIIHGFAQDKGFQIPDSLKAKSFEEIDSVFLKSLGDSIKQPFYSQVLLAKAKQDDYELGLAKAYRYMSFNYIKDFPKRILYLDSSISIGEKIKKNDYPEVSYSNLGWVYYHTGSYSKSIESHLLALKYADISNNKRLSFVAKHNVAFMKTKIGEYEDAIRILREVMKYYDENEKTNRTKLLVVLTLANTYRKVNISDSATFYNKKGAYLANKNNLKIRNFFTLNEGVNLFQEKKYQASLDSILKGIPGVLKDDTVDREFLISGYLYLGKLFKIFNKDEKSLQYLLEIDRFYEETNFTSIEIREGYEMLINYYKKENNKNKQLYFINKLFTIDSVLDLNYKNLSKTIVTEYDTPKLLKEKQNLIDDLEQKEKKTNIKFWIVLAIAVILIFFMMLIYTKNIRYKKRFQELMNVETNVVSIKKENINKSSSTTESIGISEEIVNSVLEGLQKFEKKESFLSSNITTGDLAKQLKTNSKYLSKIINTYKKKSFSVYINELRIDYVINKLKNDSKFRLYTIKAISREIGFNTTEAFSKSFYKKTGIYPSYFIKQIGR